MVSLVTGADSFLDRMNRGYRMRWRVDRADSQSVNPINHVQRICRYVWLYCNVDVPVGSEHDLVFGHFGILGD